VTRHDDGPERWSDDSRGGIERIEAILVEDFIFHHQSRHGRQGDSLSASVPGEMFPGTVRLRVILIVA
jgi:hypothetical protein